jgi:hypothetical protein
MLAQLMIFSGRPDPTFELPDEALNELASRVADVVGAAPSDGPPEGGLGYRGFRITNVEGRSDLPDEFEVFRGILTESAQGTPRHWADGAGVEALLLTQARDAGLGELLDAAGLDPGVA